jgi:Isocitrate/isopropylmalate dehydrogenase
MASSNQPMTSLYHCVSSRALLAIVSPDFAWTMPLHRARLCCIIAHKRTALPWTEGLFIGPSRNSVPSIRPSRSIRCESIHSVRPSRVGIRSFVSSPPRTCSATSYRIRHQAFGGVGLAPSLNAGSDHAMAQAVHGTAPDIAGKGLASPSALILPTAQLLDWLYQRTHEPTCRPTAQLIQHGVAWAIAGGSHTADLGGNANTSAFAKAVITAMRNADVAA